VWLYDNPICTGLGDRLGLILSLSALARLHNGVVYMEWCTEPERALLGNPMFLRYIPQWTGYNYPLEILRTYISLPENVRFYTSDQPYPHFSDEQLVQWGLPDQLPPHSGIPQTNTLYGKALRLGPARWTDDEYRRAYRAAGEELRPTRADEDRPYVLVHFRTMDHNTFQSDEVSFCTLAVLHRLHDAGVYMKVISNNHTIALRWMWGLASVHMVHHRPAANSAFNDIRLALGAAAIVQHAANGWSAYTSVPAMAKNTPLLNTFMGSDHRFDVFARFAGGMPDAFYSCAQIDAFMELTSRFHRPRSDAYAPPLQAEPR
jgi:hypothetical protein